MSITGASLVTQKIWQIDGIEVKAIWSDETVPERSDNDHLGKWRRTPEATRKTEVAKLLKWNPRAGFRDFPCADVLRELLLNCTRQGVISCGCCQFTLQEDLYIRGMNTVLKEVLESMDVFLSQTFGICEASYKDIATIRFRYEDVFITRDSTSSKRGLSECSLKCLLAKSNIAVLCKTASLPWQEAQKAISEAEQCPQDWQNAPARFLCKHWGLNRDRVGDYDIFERDLPKLQAGITQLEKKKAMLGKNRATLQERCGISVSFPHDDGNIGWQKKSEDLQKKHEDLQEKYERFEAEHKTLMAERDQWRRGKEELLEKAGAWWEEKVKLKEELEECEVDVKGLRRVVAVLENKVDERDKALEEKDTALKGLQAEIERLRLLLQPNTRANKRIRTEE